MKHLMKSGQGQGLQHSHGHSGPHSAMAHAHVYTLAGNPPNVVDLTDSREHGKKTGKRPWSRSSRAARNATLGDITSGGMIRSASVALDGPFAGASEGSAERMANRLAGVGRLWRGVQTMFVGCVPAHALYFSSYEAVKSFSLTSASENGGNGGGHVGHDTLSSSQAALAGGAATLLHDLVMTPMDTVKQRMQLGHYEGMGHAFSSIVRGDAAKGVAGEGWTGLYRSLPVTVMTNLPYGMIMMTTNEWIRAAIEDGLYGVHGAGEESSRERPFHFATVLLSGMGAGTAASAATAPLDRVKTRLQTQRMGMAGNGGVSGVPQDGRAAAILEERAAAAARGERAVCPRVAVTNLKSALSGEVSAASSAASCATAPPPSSPAAAAAPPRAHYAGVREALASILAEEGPRGLFRGALPRVALHAPSVAISWTAYEAAKGWLLWAR